MPPSDDGLVYLTLAIVVGLPIAVGCLTVWWFRRPLPQSRLLLTVRSALYWPLLLLGIYLGFALAYVEFIEHRVGIGSGLVTVMIYTAITSPRIRRIRGLRRRGDAEFPQDL